MTTAGEHVYVLVQEPHEYSERATVELYVDALDAIVAARKRCDPTRFRILTAEDDTAALVFHGYVPQTNAEVTVTRRVLV